MSYALGVVHSSCTTPVFFIKLIQALIFLPSNDLKNVEDADEDVSTTGELFSISSFGVDYPVETLVSRMEKKVKK